MHRKYGYHPRMSKHHSPTEQSRLQQLLRQVRVDAGLRQTDLAAKLGQPQSFVSKYESGERRLDILELRLVCQAVGVTLEEFAARLERSLP
jgi:transcriptional regulator with XRE-family HTH domain